MSVASSSRGDDNAPLEDELHQLPLVSGGARGADGTPSGPILGLRESPRSSILAYFAAGRSGAGGAGARRLRAISWARPEPPLGDPHPGTFRRRHGRQVVRRRPRAGAPRSVPMAAASSGIARKPMKLPWGMTSRLCARSGPGSAFPSFERPRPNPSGLGRMCGWQKC